MSHPAANWKATPPTHFSYLVRSAIRRVILTILVPAAWISLTLVYVAFFAPTFSFFQDFVIVVVSLLVLVATIAGMWVSYGMRLYRHWMDE
jgi:hypothetical protein